MPHYKSFFDRDYLYAFDLQGRDVTVTIDRVTAGELTSVGGRKTKKPLCYFVGKTKPLAVNATNGKTVASLYGTNTDDWKGKRITLYPTTTQMGGETVDCIRIRPIVPNGAIQHPPAPEDPADTESDA